MHKFVLFESDHIAVVVLTLIVPVILALTARRSSASVDAVFRYGLAALLIGTWIAWYALFIARGWLGLGNGLPLNLCDWATIALLVTLIRPNQKTFELAYFWAFAGTIQGLITPDVNYSFPEPQFVVFFLGHAAIIAAAIYSRWAHSCGRCRLRFHASSVGRWFTPSRQVLWTGRSARITASSVPSPITRPSSILWRHGRITFRRQFFSAR
jgi:hypothetical integral membrane protein (TIGR02206 family)